jgi:Domain of unknown function (DUF5666)
MLRQLTVLVPFVSALSAGSVFMATLASAGPTFAEDGPRAAIVGTVASVSGSTYTMSPGPDGSSISVNVTSDTIYVNADGSSADGSAVKSGVIIAAEGTPSDDAKTLTAERITIGAPRDGLRVSGDGPPPTEGARAAVAAQVETVSGSTYTMPARPDGSSLVVRTSSTTTYLNTDGSSSSASAVKAGVFIMAEGTLSDQGKTLTADRITIGQPRGPVFRSGGE